MISKQLQELSSILEKLDSEIDYSLNDSKKVLNELLKNKQKLISIFSKNEDCELCEESSKCKNIKNLVPVFKSLVSLILHQEEENQKMKDYLLVEKRKTKELIKENKELYLDSLTSIWNRHKYNLDSAELLREWKSLKITFSGWVCEIKERDEEIKVLEERVDKKLYIAKKQWKNINIV